MKAAKLIVALSLPLATAIANANPKDDEFEKIAKDYIETHLSSHPEFATELGDHRFDGVLTDYSPETRARAAAITPWKRAAATRLCASAAPECRWNRFSCCCVFMSKA